MKIQVKIDLSVYPIECVYAAAYTFSKAAYVKLGKDKGGALSAVLESKNGKFPAGRDLEGEFRNELLHHAFRLKVSAVNQALRERIVVRALLSAQPRPAEPAAAAPVLDAELEKEIEKLLKEAESGDYKTDALGIAIPWEENKNAKARKAKRKN
ncbi:MAG: hypothetical protein M0011_11920 [Elusimicrobia bacterium]|nr:hypothetical protein [Elusimicrobiota bacterium]